MAEAQQRTEAIERIYQAFQFEKLVCPRVVDALGRDGALVERLSLFKNRKEIGIANLIKSSPVSSDEAVRYFLEHPDYLAVDVDYHGSTYFVYLKGTAIFCTPTLKRLKEIEAYGASAPGWKLREHFLKDFLSDMHIPTLEDGMEEGKSLPFVEEFFGEAKRLYRGPAYQARLVNWAKQLVAPVKAEIDRVEAQDPAKYALFLFCSRVACADPDKQPPAQEIADMEKAIREHIAALKQWVGDVETGMGRVSR